MGRLSENVLDELRSPAAALAELVDRFNTVANNHPDLPLLARMIRQLTDEIVSRRGVRVLQ
jgi:hypothetical protein